jgi:hypothetical protein
MTNRREFIKLGTAVSAWAVGAAQGSSKTLPLDTNVLATTNLYKVVADQRYAASVQFAEQAQQQGLAVHLMLKGDITSFWYHELHAIWQHSPRGVAGLTEAGPLFCLEQLGAQYGLRVIHREQQPNTPLIAWALGLALKKIK